MFGRRDKKKEESNERVLNLKARVDALRHADAASRQPSKPVSFDHFLEGDDVLTGREVEDNYEPTGFAADVDPDGQQHGQTVDLEAELQKYLQRQEEQGQHQGQQTHQPPSRPPAQPENSSLLLDGTWSRDDVSPPHPPTGALPVNEPSWTPASDEEPSTDANVQWPSSFDNAWPSSKDWPAEEEWPPRDEAV